MNDKEYISKKNIDNLKKSSEINKKNEIYNNILEAFKALMIDTIENKRNREIKKAFKRKTTNDLETLLKYNTNYELNELMDILNIKYKSYDKKEILISRIKGNYASVVKNIFKYINNECYKDLLFLYKNKGIIKKNDINKIKYKFFLQEIGILYTSSDEKGEICLSSPMEVLELIKKVDVNEINHNSKIISLFKGCIYYYGAISINNFIEILEENSLDYRDLSHIEKIIELDSEYENMYTYINGVGIHLVLHEEFELLEIIDNNISKYKKLTEEQLINASNNNYIAKNKLYKPLIDILYNYYYIEFEDLEEILKVIYAILQLEGLDSAMNYVYSKFEIPSLIEYELKNTLENTYNKLPLWKYKGFNTEEFRSIIKNNLKYIKTCRNEMCICGSGKKYKNCCGDNIIKITE